MILRSDVHQAYARAQAKDHIQGPLPRRGRARKDCAAKPAIPLGADYSLQ